MAFDLSYMSSLVGSMSHNILLIDDLLTQADRTLATQTGAEAAKTASLRGKLQAIRDQQAAALNVVSGITDTQELASLQHDETGGDLASSLAEGPQHQANAPEGPRNRLAAGLPQNDPTATVNQSGVQLPQVAAALEQSDGGIFESGPGSAAVGSVSKTTTLADSGPYGIFIDQLQEQQQSIARDEQAVTPDVIEAVARCRN